MSAGYMAFVRQISNKLVEMQKKSPEVANCLESIPEWNVYYEEDLKVKNMLENKPLVMDPRKKGAVSNDDDLEFFFKLKNFNPTKKSERQEKVELKDEEYEHEMEAEEYETNKYANHRDDDDNKDFEELICHEENDHDEEEEEDQNELHKYFSNAGLPRRDEDDEDNQQPQPLSMNDLESKGTEEIETKEPESHTFQAPFFWKVEESYDLDTLMQDYN